jgi:hypothetical protein
VLSIQKLIQFVQLAVIANVSIVATDDFNHSIFTRVIASKSTGLSACNWRSKSHVIGGQSDVILHCTNSFLLTQIMLFRRFFKIVYNQRKLRKLTMFLTPPQYVYSTTPSRYVYSHTRCFTVIACDTAEKVH